MLETIRHTIHEFLDSTPLNRLGPDSPEPAWDKFTMGAARGDDPMFQRIKDHIGSFVWTPEEAFSLHFPDIPVKARDLAVISWILPQRPEVKAEHKKQRKLPSDNWVRVKKYGQACSQGLADHLESFLASISIPAIAPGFSLKWARRTSSSWGYASNWSERHVAMACGLGTFGLSDGLITPMGIAMRAGSIVALLDVEPASRPYGDDHHAYCLFFASDGKKKCLACAKRCPAGAISANGHDKEKCHDYIRNIVQPATLNVTGEAVNSCGLCQTGVPCESKIPVWRYAQLGNGRKS